MNGTPALICRDERRRAKVRAKQWNGLDYVEVVGERQQANTLRAFFLGKAPRGLTEGEHRRPRLPAGRPRGPRDGFQRLLFSTIRSGTTACGSPSTGRGIPCPTRSAWWRWTRRGGPPASRSPASIPATPAWDSRFTIGCPSDLDCKTERICPPEPREEPAINYLAKDYASFRQLILDRLALTLPDWKERHVPDLGIALVEVLAYVGDYLSYYQDAVATEAYLDTARRRISVRRHVRLVDYPMHEGCNARAWVFVEAGADQSFQAGKIYFITGFDPAPPDGKLLTEQDLSGVPGGRYLVFEPVTDDPKETITFREAHNEIHFYTWDDAECCLPKGATRATLRDEWVEETPPPVQKPHGYDAKGQEEECEPPSPPPPRKRTLALQVGDLLLFEELIGPHTGQPGDADRSHRHVVRLTCVEESVDELDDQPVLEVEWDREDALPFPLCISAIGGEDCRLLEVSVARGNVLLVDHGGGVSDDPWRVEAGDAKPRCEGEGRLSEVPQTTKPFHPVLQQAPLTFRQPLPPAPRSLPAARLLAQDPRQARPQIKLTAAPEVFAGVAWSAQRDLLDSGPDDLHFVAEVDDDGRAHLRFGNGENGFAPAAGATFTAEYRIGNGRAGNVGAEAIHSLVWRDGSLPGVTFRPRNPLPARGGVDPEPLADVRLLAPHAFRTDLQRAVTADDYARLTERDFAGRVQRAAATLRWTGSWTEALVAVDPWSGEADVDGLLREIRRRLSTATAASVTTWWCGRPCPRRSTWP